MKAQLLFGGILLLGLTLSGGCKKASINRSEGGVLFLGSEDASDTVERVIAPGQRTLVLEGFSGAIQLVASDSDVARLSILRTARADSPDEAQERLRRLDIEEVGDETTYRYRFESPDDAMSRFDVTGSIPVTTPLRIRWTAGNISIDGLTGEVDVQNHHGDVSYSGGARIIRLRTRNGGISAELAGAPSPVEVDLQTINGDVDAGLAAGTGAHLEASTSAGTISLGSLGLLSESYTPMDAGARFEARIGDGTGRISLTTQYGSIRLSAYVPPVAEPAGVQGAMPADSAGSALPDTVIASADSFQTGGLPVDSLK